MNLSFAEAFAGQRVFITGHTGFKGSWLAEWLLLSGAEVHGFALEPATQPALFTRLDLARRLHSHEIGDICDAKALHRAVMRARPDHVFHLAAQPLVRASYQQPRSTWETNVQGSIHLLEALREMDSPCAAVFVTTDKVYHNPENGIPFRETDPLGGHDPYSSSKAGAEIAIASWRESFFQSHPVRIASARAGNVIGGGDWAADRLVPDAIRALQQAELIPVRSPHSVRPWQHVLEPLAGYLALAARMTAQPEAAALQGAFNFGPPAADHRPVSEVIAGILQGWPGGSIDASDPKAPHEARCLRLDTEKAARLLQWHSRWDFSETIRRTVQWYRNAWEGKSIRQLVAEDIQAWECARESSFRPGVCRPSDI